MCNGVYVNGMVEDIPVVFTADTGASVTIISTKVYNQIREDVRPRLSKACCLKGAGGSPIRELGKAEFALKLHQLEVTCNAIVADIEDDALLGYDVLMGGEMGPADILLSQGKVVIGGHEIPCIQSNIINRSRKVTVAEDCHIPANSEVVLDVYVERNIADDNDQMADYLIESSNHFKETYHLMMEAKLVNLNRNVNFKISVFNPYSSDVTLRKHTEIGKAEKICAVITTVKLGKQLRERENKMVDEIHIPAISDSLSISSIGRVRVDSNPFTTQPGSTQVRDNPDSGNSRFDTGGCFSKSSDLLNKTGLHEADCSKLIPICKKPKLLDLSGNTKPLNSESQTETLVSEAVITGLHDEQHWEPKGRVCNCINHDGKQSCLQETNKAAIRGYQRLPSTTNYRRGSCEFLRRTLGHGPWKNFDGPYVALSKHCNIAYKRRNRCRDMSVPPFIRQQGELLNDDTHHQLTCSI